MVKNLETAGRADIIYLTDAVEDEMDSKGTQDISPNMELFLPVTVPKVNQHAEDTKSRNVVG